MYREGEERFLVRSMHNSGAETVFMRSVSPELDDLEPGKYFVIFKVTACRSAGYPTADEVINKYSIERKQKLLHVGRRFDLAQSKGDLQGLEESNRRRTRREVRDKNKACRKKDRKFAQAEKQKAKKRKERVENAMKEKRRVMREKTRKKLGMKMKAREEARLAKESAEVKTADARPTILDGGHGTVAGPTKEGLTDVPKAEQDAATTVAKTDKGDLNAGAKEADGVPQEVPLEKSVSRPRIDSTNTVSGLSPPSETIAKSKTDGPASRDAQTISKDLAMLDLNQIGPKQAVSGGALGIPAREHGNQNRQASGDHIEESDLSPPEQLEELSSNDCSWDSDLDGPVFSSTESNDASKKTSGLFEQDEWNAMLCLELRVYSIDAETKVRVVKGDKDS